MASLGTWGALRGAGEGVMANAERAAAEQTAERQARIDEARDMRLLKAQQTFQAETREDEQAHGTAMVGVETEANRELLNAEQGQLAAREGQGRVHESEENRLDRESAERIAGMRAEGSDSAAAIEARERFEPRTGITTTPGQFGPVETSVDTLFDKETRRTYVQQGMRFIPQGVDPASIRAAAASELDKLAENISDPLAAVEFLEIYNYLPAWYVEALPSRRTR